MKAQIEELFRNQNQILEGGNNLNDRMDAIEENMDDDNINDIQEILDSQANENQKFRI